MKIAVVSDVIYPWVVGGGEKRYYEVFRRLAKRHEIHFYTMFYKGMPSREFEYEGIKVHCVCDAPKNLYSGRRRKIIPAIRFTQSLHRKLKQGKFDLIECNEFPFLPCFTAKRIARRQKIPLVVTWHEVWGDYWDEYLGFLGFAGRRIERRVSKISDRIVSVSSSTSEKLERELGVDKRKVVTINNGVDVKLIKKIKAGKEGDKVIFVGRLIPEKNVDLLIKSLPEDLKLVVIGEGPEKDGLDKLARESGKKVEFKPFLNYESLLKELKSASLFAILSEREGFSITALEAVACGTPVLALSNSLPSEIEELCCTTTKDGIRRDILRYINKKPKKHEIDRFDWDVIAKRVEKVYGELK
ncbi:glycosyltransferase family 4 protein [Candidatus Micrarchaeota archaeon]|nr:glycosyltransferase family 4 protein [Candidatus Micrarchaeota archaeon]